MFPPYHTITPMRYLGVDYGSKKVGLALSDEAGTMGFPHTILMNTPHLLEEVCALIKEKNVQAVVIGESRTLPGGENPIAIAARTFGSALAKETGLPVYYESEVLTSEEARQSLHKAGKSRSPRQHELVDAQAAALILTSYLSRSRAEV